ncbi:hypothetical protein GCM10012286_62100 [Streptomyces lasiicapitis]|uniref:GNAT family N-acetyltransferase n=1 Tax=Streptomyces lasiicapitis TaxID=1923961 RepID=A0ABQ2MJP5_9ACTN|nr:hypothetical protein GCM10012286_62100 [Streptomyces lasiicapitis]
MPRNVAVPDIGSSHGTAAQDGMHGQGPDEGAAQLSLLTAPVTAVGHDYQGRGIGSKLTHQAPRAPTRRPVPVGAPER